jgi:hypothetical protein
MSTIRLFAAMLVVAFLLSGVLQWLVLRRRLRRAGWWIPATVGGWIGAVLVAAVVSYGIENVLYSYGSFARGILYTVAAGPCIGAVIGASQMLVLRRRVPRAGRWIVASIFGVWCGSVPVVVFSVLNQLGMYSSLASLIAAIGLFGALYGLVTASPLERMLAQAEAS